MSLLIEQLLNGVQLGLTLFLLAAGLTLIFGIMGVINLAHGSFYMIGAFVGATAAVYTGSFWLALPAGILGAALAGLLVEFTIIRQLYARDHLDQVLATFGLILLINELVAMTWGRSPLLMNGPPILDGFVPLIAGISYPTYRLAMMATGIAVAVGLYFLIGYTRVGMLIRAGASNRDMVAVLGVDIGKLFALVFALGAMLAGFAGVMVAPILSVQIGMGEQILILTFVVIVVGGVGSVRGAFVGALLIGMVDTLGRAFLPMIFKSFLSGPIADGLGAAMASVAIYLVMALVLVFRPRGMFPVQGS